MGDRHAHKSSRAVAPRRPTDEARRPNVIIQPNDLPERLKNCRRCGVAGTRSLQIAMEDGADPDLPFGSKSSNLVDARCILTVGLLAVDYWLALLCPLRAILDLLIEF